MPIEYILLGVGIVLLGIEAVVPGFGFFGVTGLISLLAGSYYLLGGGAEAAYILLGVVLALGAVVALLFVYLPAESKWNPFVLWEKQENRHGYTGAEDRSTRTVPFPLRMPPPLPLPPLLRLFPPPQWSG